MFLCGLSRGEGGFLIDSWDPQRTKKLEQFKSQLMNEQQKKRRRINNKNHLFSENLQLFVQMQNHFHFYFNLLIRPFDQAEKFRLFKFKAFII